MPVTASTASRSSPREITASIPSHSCSSVISVPYPVISNSTSTAAASFAEARASRGCARTLSLSKSRPAFPSSSVAISRSSSSSASSIALDSRWTTVDSSVASLRGGGCRRIWVALAVIP